MDDMPESVVVEVKEPNPGEDKKSSKGEVDYSRGDRSAHCGICKHYTWATYDVPLCDGKCELVEGYIDPSFWCELFEKQGAPEKKKTD